MTNRTMAQEKAPVTGYAPVNGLQMYYEIHGEGQPLVLLHGALSATGTSFGTVLPLLAKTRQVISVEQQAHGHTADIDRPLTAEQMAEDTAALLKHIRVQNADVFGYSMGSSIAMHLATRYPQMVRKLVLASASYTMTGMHPGLMDGLDLLTPEIMVGSPFHEEYMRIAPRPEDFPRMVEKVKQLNRSYKDWPFETVKSIQAPVMLVIGDSDIVQPEHTVEMFRMFGGGVVGDNVGLPASRLAILPGTTHITLAYRGEWLAPMITEFLDAPMPEVKSQ